MGPKGGRETGRRDGAKAGGRWHLRASPKSMIFTICPVAATQRMFSGCGDRETIAPPLRGDIPSVWVWQPMGPAADPHHSTDSQAPLPWLASVGDTLPSRARQGSGPAHSAPHFGACKHPPPPRTLVSPIPTSSGRPLLSPPAPHLEVEVEDAHVVHEADALTDLPDEHHAVHLRQVVVIVDDPLEELAALHAASGRTAGLPGAPCPKPSSCRAPCPPWGPWPSPTVEMLA